MEKDKKAAKKKGSGKGKSSLPPVISETQYYESGPQNGSRKSIKQRPSLIKTKGATWKEWNPGLDNDHLTLGQVYDTLPGNNDFEIHWLVRLLENPKSPVALPGAIDLFNHDCIHILLGRGLLAQDEAFVIGFTMGTARSAKTWQTALFRFIANRLYPRIYKMSDNDLAAYDLGFVTARNMKAQRLHRFDFKPHMDTPLGVLRQALCIHTGKLCDAYVKEKQLLPETPCSERLPV